MKQYLTFPTAQQALDYRREHGTGGWVFCAAPGSGESVIFPHDMTATPCLLHPLIRGQQGELKA